MDGYDFTIEEIEELLPEIAVLVEEALIVQKELREVYEYTTALKIETDFDEKVLTNDFPTKVKKKIMVLTDELNDILEEIEETGVIIKDVEQGIVDFPSTFQGKEMYFCWKFGEKNVEHWHEEHCNFKSRKKILKIGKWN